MKIGHSVEVANPYDWLPAHGESGVKMLIEGSDLVVTVSYDSEDGIREKRMRFFSICAFHVQAFPGPSLFVDEIVTSSVLQGALVEYPESEMAAAWEKHFGGARIVKHYSIAFLAENLILIIFGDGFSEED
ncbi:hypothetical protein [Burkholderia ubonensis]|uniref:hypothetical protein n=1 Tax=Burkholderia ubonensis TaxID=101571 RepID=UPI00358E18C2